MLARLLKWLGRGALPPENGKNGSTEVPEGAVLLAGGVGYGFELLGQATHQASLETIYHDHRADGADCHVIAAIVSGSDHGSDPYAIGVTICGLKVGHFSREDGKRYRRVITDVAGRGRVVCRASIRASPRAGAGPGAGERFRVSLDLASPARAAPPEQG